MSKIKYAQIHIGDFLSGCIQMSAAEMGAYFALVLAHYQAGTKGLEDDRQKLARMAHCDPKQWDRIKNVVLEKFYMEDGHWKHERVMEEIAKVSRKRDEVVPKSSRNCPAKIPSESLQNPAKKSQVPEIKQNTEHITSNQKPVTNAVVDARARISEITGWATDPCWRGDYGRLDQWTANGWDLELDILPTIERLMLKRTGPPRTLKYFEQAIADAYASRMQPLPEGKPNGTDSKKLTYSQRNQLAKQKALADLGVETPGG